MNTRDQITPHMQDGGEVKGENEYERLRRGSGSLILESINSVCFWPKQWVHTRPTIVKLKTSKPPDIPSPLPPPHGVSRTVVLTYRFRSQAATTSSDNTKPRVSESQRCWPSRTCCGSAPARASC